MDQPSRPDPRNGLNQIETEWSVVFDPAQFVARYAAAIHSYFLALVKNPDEAEEVAQDFFLWVTKNGFPRAKKERGRFRDYLKVSVRNAALNFIQRKRSRHAGGVDLSQVPDPDDSAATTDQLWLAEWRDCLLQRAWQELKKHQDQSARNPSYTVLRLTADNPDDDSGILAAHASRLLGRPVQPDAFRKQVSRARRLFAQILVHEIAQSLDRPTPDQVTEELADLGLMSFVRDFLPARYRGGESAS